MADEKTWVLNIKRGLISAFQTDTEIREGVADVTEVRVIKGEFKDNEKLEKRLTLHGICLFETFCQRSRFCTI